MWNTQRNHLNFMKNQTVISFDHEVLISTLDRPKKAWNDGTNVELFFILKLCFLQGLLLRSDMSKSISKMALQRNCNSHMCWGERFLQAASGDDKRFNLVLRGWQGTPGVLKKWIFSFFNKAGLYYLEYTFAC